MSLQVFNVHLQKSQAKKAREGETFSWVMDFLPLIRHRLQSAKHHCYQFVITFTCLLLVDLWQCIWHVVYDTSLFLHSCIFNHLTKQEGFLAFLNIWITCAVTERLIRLPLCVSILVHIRKSQYFACYDLPVTGLSYMYYLYSQIRVIDVSLSANISHPRDIPQQKLCWMCSNRYKSPGAMVKRRRGRGWSGPTVSLSRGQSIVLEYGASSASSSFSPQFYTNTWSRTAPIASSSAYSPATHAVAPQLHMEESFELF